MNKNKLESYIERFKDYKVPKYIEDELLHSVIRLTPCVKIANKYYKFNSSGTLKISTPSNYYITNLKRKMRTIKLIITKLYEYKDSIVERAFGIEFTFNGVLSFYNVGYLGAKIFDFKDLNYYIFKIGYTSQQSFYSSFNLDNKRIVRSQIWFNEYRYYNYEYKHSKTYLYNLSNKYLRDFTNLYPHDILAIRLFPKLETCYRKHGELVQNPNLACDFIKLFCSNKLKVRPKLFIKYNITSIPEYIIRYNYPTYVFSDCDRYIFEDFYSLLNDGYDFNYLYKHYKNIRMYKDYLRLLESNKLDLDIYPYNLVKAHDDIVAKVKYLAKANLIESINDVCHKYRKLEFIYNDYKFFIPSLNDMIDYSKELNLCIYAAGYIERVAEHKCILLFCEKTNNPTKLEKFACELVVNNNEFEIVQFHGFNNDLIQNEYFKTTRSILLNILKDRLKRCSYVN